MKCFENLIKGIYESTFSANDLKKYRSKVVEVLIENSGIFLRILFD